MLGQKRMKPARKVHPLARVRLLRRVAVSVVLALALVLATLALAVPSGRNWQRNPRDPRWVQGQIDLDTPAPEVWDRITEVRGWPALFSDISAFAIESESADRARWLVRFESKTVGHGAHDYSIVLDEGRRSGRIVVHAPAIRGAAYVSVAPIDDQRSRVRYAIFVERSGAFGWLLPESWLRAYQERLVERDLGDLQKAFGATSAR